MTWIAGILAGALLVQQILHRRETAQLLARQDVQVRALADRIQHPEIRQVEPGPDVEVDPPRDAAELAQVGLEVPSWFNVGEEAPGG